MYTIGCNTRTFEQNGQLHVEARDVRIVGGSILITHFHDDSGCHGLPLEVSGEEGNGAPSYLSGECFLEGSSAGFVNYGVVSCTKYSHAVADVSISPTPTTFPSTVPDECSDARLTTYFSAPGVPANNCSDDVVFESVRGHASLLNG